MIEIFLWMMLQPGYVRNVPLAWDAMPVYETWTEVRIYELRADGTYLLTGTAKCQPGPPIVCPTTITVSFPDKALHNLIARAYDGEQESDDSNMVTLPKGPVTPGHFKRP